MKPEKKALIEDLRLEAEALLLEAGVMQWRSHEYGEPVNLRSVFRGHERLCSPDTARLVRRAASAASDPDEKRALDYFFAFAAGLFLADRTAGDQDRLTNSILRAKVRVEGRSVPYRAVGALVANEPDRSRRRAIHSAAMSVLARLNPQYAKIWDKQHSLCREIGFGYIRFSEIVRSVALRRTAALARAVLDRTENLYLKMLDEQSRALLGFGADEIRRSDIPRLMRNPAVEEYFPAERLLPTVEETAGALGFDLGRMGNLRIFAQDRPNKAPRAACFPLKVPGDVRISLRPIGGLSDYEVLLHETGHGLHFANTRTDRFEFQHLGPNTITETYAYLLQYLVENRDWLRRHVGMPEKEIARYLAFRAFSRLYALRRYAAKVLYEIGFHGGRRRARDAYRELLSRAYGFPLSREDATSYLSDIDPTFYSADYFRAWLLEASLAEYIKERFGERWFEKKAAGRFLAGLWASGNRMTGEDLLAEIGRRTYSIAVWMKRVRSLVGR